jgi:hypothetical protein
MGKVIQNILTNMTIARKRLDKHTSAIISQQQKDIQY